MPTTDTKDPCNAERRHMPAHVFVTYDAMRGCIGMEPERIYWGGAHKLANLNDRNVASERAALVWLEENGWIVKQNTEGQRRWNGKMDTDKYRVLWHDEWRAAHPEHTCPPDKYVKDGDDWKLAVPGKLAPGLLRANVRRLLPGVFADDFFGNMMANIMGDGMAAAKAGAATDNPAPAETTVTSPPASTVTGSPVLAGTGLPAPTVTGAPVRSVTSSGNESLTTSPTSRSQNPEAGGAEVFAPSSADAEGDQEAEAEKAVAELEEFERQHNAKLWRRFMAAVPEEMRGAVASKEQKTAILKQLLTCDVPYLIKAIEDWVEERDMPIEERKFGKWGCWLAECEPFVQEQRKEYQRARRVKDLQDFRDAFVPTIASGFFDSDLSAACDRTNCENIGRARLPYVEQREKFAKWESYEKDLRWRYQLWAEADDPELDDERARMRADVIARPHQRWQDPNTQTGN